MDTHNYSNTKYLLIVNMFKQKQNIKQVRIEKTAKRKAVGMIEIRNIWTKLSLSLLFL